VAVPLPDDVSRRLPKAYVTTLELIAEGATDDEVAARVGVDATAVAALVRLATAKLLQVQAHLGSEPRETT
jgi:hypothetical protein